MDESAYTSGPDEPVGKPTAPTMPVSPVPTPGLAGPSVDVTEAVGLAAVDWQFYCSAYFPRTVRQAPASFHELMWDTLDSTDRKVGFMCFRGSAKTTTTRLYISRRISYGLSRTILIVGKSEDSAKRSVEWLMRQVEYNRPWADTFGLRKGSKWSGEEIEIFHGAEDIPIRVIALGIRGSTRGINVDDYRPDLIIVDDPCDEENTATAEQRKKTEDYVLGSLYNSLAPETEAPLAKIVVLQTLLHKDDVISKCAKDPSWQVVTIPVFDPLGRSSWPARWSTETLLKEKSAFVARGKLGLWMREMECKVVAEELAAFRAGALQYYDILPAHDELTTFLICDPVPPPSERELEAGLRDKDYEAWAVVGLWRDLRTGVKKIFLCEYRLMRGHDPEWSLKTFFELLERWKPIKLKVESVAYQRTLAWLIEKAMRARNRWVAIDAHVPERRKKSYRIIDSLGAAVADGLLYVSPHHGEFVEQFTAYPNVEHDDLIEAVAVGVAEAMGNPGGGSFGAIQEIEEADYEELPLWGTCP